ncbi:protein JINGUBANG-like [Salvia miltiorrhiza]|uniref:protein JINGUBANG-like n=1 Tax=Salvia miltiorrhiza TaxID=226208 RepID=UPI0025ABBC43|nr:protein JINGUBANG-like [Salvia miltiorrhiza]
MTRFLPCPLPCNCDKHEESSHKSQLNNQISDTSSSNSSLTSHPSLPSVPSLEHAASAAAAAAAANHHCLATLKGHSSYVFSLALVGKHLYSGASDGEIRAWDRGSLGHAATARGCSAVKSITVLGGKIITAHGDHRIRVWRINDHLHQTQTQNRGHFSIITVGSDSNNPVTTAAVRLKLAATLPTAGDRCMRLFSAGSYVEVRRHRRRTWVHHADAVAALAASADGALLYSVSWDRSMKVWRSSDFRCVESVQAAHDDAINAVAAAVDGSVYTGSADRLIKVWRRRDGERRHSLVATLERHKSAVNALALSTDGNTLYSGACDRSIIVWEKGGAAAGGGGMVVAGALRGHKRSILCLAVAAELLCSGSADGSVRVWRRGSGNSHSCVAVLEGHKCPVKCLVACLDRSYSEVKKNDDATADLGNNYLVYSGGMDFDIKVWKIWVPSL